MKIYSGNTDPEVFGPLIYCITHGVTSHILVFRIVIIIIFRSEAIWTFHPDRFIVRPFRLFLK